MHSVTPAPAISIVMPLRDAAGTLERALDSILAQTWTDWELIAVDDGSVDATPDILHAHAGRDRRVRVLTTAPRGIAAALQTGCDTARGAWIARMDGDDLMHPGRLAGQWEFAQCHPGLGVVSCLVGYVGDAPGYAAHVDWLNTQVSPADIALRRFVEAPVAHPSVMFRRDLIERHGGYRDGDFPEDYELWLRWLDAGVRFGKVPERLLEWHDSPGRTSRCDPRYAVERFAEVKCRYLARWLRDHVAPERRLWLWGAGRITRRRFDPLERDGLRLAGFIDIDPKKSGRHRDGRPVVMADQLPDRREAFVLAGVASRGAREAIATHLTARGWVEGTDFLMVA
jgi:glycosyltransferase involved in cell wall biosynthesis